jgi:hypothetical protein
VTKKSPLLRVDALMDDRVGQNASQESRGMRSPHSRAASSQGGRRSRSIRSNVLLVAGAAETCQMSPRLRRAIALATLATCLLTTSRSFAQGNTSRITGSVTDASGSALPGVTITATAVNQHPTTTTSNDGRFALAGLTPGVFLIVVELPGFKTLQREIVITAPSTVAADFMLHVDVTCSREVLYVLDDASATRRKSSLVAHLVVLTRSAKVRNDVSWCSPPYQYTATVIRELKNPVFNGVTNSAIPILSNLDLAPGDEGVGWLAWNASLRSFVFTSNGGDDMFSRLKDGHMVWRRQDIDIFTDQATVDEFFDGLNALSQTPDRK